MSDIVDRLKKPVMLHSNPEQTNAERREAAAEIERLRGQLADWIRRADNRLLKITALRAQEVKTP